MSIDRLSLLKNLVAKQKVPPVLPLVEVELTAESGKEEPVPVEVWNACVEEAKGVLALMRQHRFKIAELAMKACGVTPHKRHSVGLDKKRELRRFAKEVGVHPATLSEWVIIKKNVIDNLKPTDYDPDNYMALLRTRRRIKTRTPPEAIVQIYKEESSRNPVQLKIESIHRRLHTIYNTFQTINLGTVEEDKLRNIAHWCTGIVDQINASLKPKTRKRHKL